MIQFTKNVVKALSTKKEGIPNYIDGLPEEILKFILKQLTVTQLLRCRAVCGRWKETIDNITERDEYWKEVCERDYAMVYKQARYQAHPDLSNFQLYKSLRLWKDLKYARVTFSTAIKANEVRFEHASYGNVAATIDDDTVINYYDAKTLDIVKRLNIGCNFTDFLENDYLIAYFCDSGDVNVIKEFRMIPKEDGIPVLEKTIRLFDVFSYTQFNGDIVYCTMNLQEAPGLFKFFICKPREGFESTFLKELNTDIINFGVHTDNLYVVVNETHEHQFDVYKFTGNDFIMIDTIDSFELFQDSVAKFCSYGLIRCLYSENACTTLKILTAQQYGEIIIFVGDVDGIIKVYDRKAFYANVKTRPIIVYDIRKCRISDFSITDIVVIERENGHTIALFTKNAAVFLKLDH